MRQRSEEKTRGRSPRDAEHRCDRPLEDAANKRVLKNRVLRAAACTLT